MPTLPASGYAVPVAPTVEPLAAPPGGYQDIRAPAGAFGAGMAEGMQAFGQDAAKAAEHVTNIQSFYDQIASDEKVNQVEDKINKKLYGDPSVPGDVGYLGLQGDQAMNSRDATRKAIDSILLEHRSAVGNLNQQHMFDQQTRRYRNTALQQIGQHYDREFNKWTTATYENKAKLGVAAGQRAANENNFELFNDAVNSTRNGLELSMRAAGKPDAEIENAKTEVTKHMAAGWARNRIVLDPAEAEKFIDAHKDVLGDQYDNLLKAARDKADELKVDDAISGKTPRQLPSNRIGTGVFRAPSGPPIEGANPQEQRFLNEARFRESTNRYDLIHPPVKTGPHAGETAKGAYGFLDSSWKEATAGSGIGAEYPTADKAPPAVQDANALWFHRKYGTQPWAASGPYDEGTGAVVEAQGNATRNLPLAPTMKGWMERGASGGGFTVEVFSGGQPSSGPNRTGSHRHDEGGAADVQLRDVKTGQLLDMRKPADRARMAQFITGTIAAGATGVGAAEDYMGPHGIHIGGGTPAVWGGDQTSATAPGWVRAAFEAGRAGAAPAARASAPAAAPAATTGTTTPARPASGAGPQELRGSPAEMEAFYDALSKKETTAPQFDQWLAAYRAKSSARPAGEGSGGGAPAQPALDAGGDDTETTNLFYTEGSGGDTTTPPAASAGGDEPPGFQQRWADVESRLPADRPDLILKAKTKLHQQMQIEYVDQQHRRQEIERAQKQVVHTGENDVIADAFSAAPKITAQDVSVDKRFDSDPEARMRMLNLKARLAEKPLVDPVVSATTMHELMRGITTGDVDRPQIIDAFNAKPSQLSEPHFNFLMKQLEDIRTPEGLKIAKDVDKLLQAAKGSITKSNPLMGHIDASGDLQFGAFEEDVRRNIEAMKRDKKTPAEIAEWLSVKRFRDNPALLEPYQKTLQQSIQDQARTLSRPPVPPSSPSAAVPTVLPPQREFTAPIPSPGAIVAPAATPAPAPIPPVPPNAPAGVPPRLPGESPGAYMSRTGGGGMPMMVPPPQREFTAPIPLPQ